MARRKRIRTSNPALEALRFIHVQGKQKRRQFFEGVVTSKISGDATAMYVAVEFSAHPVKLPVRYMECNADAFVERDRVLIFSKNCRMDEAVVIGFTEETRDCLSTDAEVYTAEGGSALENRPYFQLRRFDTGKQLTFSFGNLVNAGTTQISKFFERVGHDQSVPVPLADSAPYLDHVTDWVMHFYFGRRPLYPLLGPPTGDPLELANAAFQQPCEWLANRVGCVPWQEQHLYCPAPNQGSWYRSADFAFSVTLGTELFQYQLKSPPYPGTYQSPYTALEVTNGDAGESAATLYCAGKNQHKTLYGAEGFKELLRFKTEYGVETKTGFRWVGLQLTLGAPMTMAVVEGRIGDGAPGVIVIRYPPPVPPATQYIAEQQQIFTPEFEIVWQDATYDVKHAVRIDYETTFSYDADQEPGIYQIRGTGCTPPPNEGPCSWKWLCDQGFYQIYIYDPCNFDENGLITCQDLGIDKLGFLRTRSEVTLFVRHVRVKSLREEIILGPPSPVVRVLDDPLESYVLVQTLVRTYECRARPPEHGWVPLDGTGSPVPFNRSINAQGHTEEKIRLYSVRVETQQKTLISETDVLMSAPNDTFTPTHYPGAKTMVVIEPRGRWRELLYSQTTTEHIVIKAWNQVFRDVNYHLFAGGSGALENDSKIPLVSPGGYRPLAPTGASRELDNNSYPAGNWQAMSAYVSPAVAAWSTEMRYENLTAFSEINTTGEFRDVQDVLHGHGARTAEYPHMPRRGIIGATEHFRVYNAQTGAVIETILGGVVSNSPGYITHPCITPDRLRGVFVAHGAFNLLGLGVKLYAGMYLFDRTNLLSPQLYFLSAVELRIPSRGLGVSAPAATGKEFLITAPSDASGIVVPGLVESRMAYWVGCRRKSFLNRKGTLVLAESGAILDVTNPNNPKLRGTFLQDRTTTTGFTAARQDHEGYRAVFPPEGG